MLEEEEEEKPAHIKKDNIELQILRDQYTPPCSDPSL